MRIISDFQAGNRKKTTTDSQQCKFFSQAGTLRPSVLSWHLETVVKWMWVNWLKLQPDTKEMLQVGKVKKACEEWAARRVSQQLNLLQRLHPFFDTSNCAILILTFVTSHLDYSKCTLCETALESLPRSWTSSSSRGGITFKATMIPSYVFRGKSRCWLWPVKPFMTQGPSIWRTVSSNINKCTCCVCGVFFFF